MSVFDEYLCHKVVKGAKITHVNVDEKIVLVENSDGEVNTVRVTDDFFKRSCPGIGDYLVIYEDGYMSHSPQKPFEQGYKLITGVQQ
jgi:hypothetical protein